MTLKELYASYNSKQKKNHQKELSKSEFTKILLSAARMYAFKTISLEATAYILQCEESDIPKEFLWYAASYYNMTLEISREKQVRELITVSI